MTFKEKVLDIVRKIPPGRTLSYSAVATLAGSPRAARAVGTIMAHNHDPSVPCHRVIKANGEFGEYNGGRERKRTLLEEESRKQATN